MFLLRVFTSQIYFCAKHSGIYQGYCCSLLFHHTSLEKICRSSITFREFGTEIFMKKGVTVQEKKALRQSLGQGIQNHVLQDMVADENVTQYCPIFTSKCEKDSNFIDWKWKNTP
ncbi:uncharacterized protein LOC132051535 [Lycium ferocissimum]|uniref:uncharacterized protein LOC132051535 n=1 Tax=Lycium ferocissimum TaxID=112874 RepID=UPI002814EEB5|nr:uncharacterized protein LOC132051535 [Lycium ferocissimum]